MFFLNIKDIVKIIHRLLFPKYFILSKETSNFTHIMFHKKIVFNHISEMMVYFTLLHNN